MSSVSVSFLKTLSLAVDQRSTDEPCTYLLTPVSPIKNLTPLIVVYGLLLEVLKNILSEPSLQSVTEEPEQTLQSIPATTTNSKHYSEVLLTHFK